MDYKFSYKTTVNDLWQLTMYYTYGSLVGVCNIIFTVAVILLTVSKWNESGDFFRVLLILGCCLFTVFQPLAFLKRARAQTAKITDTTEMEFNDTGIHIKVGQQHLTVRWKSVKRIAEKPTMVIIFADAKHGYVLSNRVLGKERKEFIRYLRSKVDV